MTTWVQIKKDGSSLSLIRRYSPELILIFGENKFPVWKADKGSCQDPNPGLLSVSKKTAAVTLGQSKQRLWRSHGPVLSRLKNRANIWPWSRCNTTQIRRETETSSELGALSVLVNLGCALNNTTVAKCFLYLWILLKEKDKRGIITLCCLSIWLDKGFKVMWQWYVSRYYIHKCDCSLSCSSRLSTFQFS